MYNKFFNFIWISNIKNIKIDCFLQKHINYQIVKLVIQKMNLRYFKCSKLLPIFTTDLILKSYVMLSFNPDTSVFLMILKSILKWRCIFFHGDLKNPYQIRSNYFLTNIFIITLLGFVYKKCENILLEMELTFLPNLKFECSLNFFLKTI